MIYKISFLIYICFAYLFNSVEGIQKTVLFTSKMTGNVNKSFPANSLFSHSVKQSWECTLLYYATENCVAVNIGPLDANGNRKCELKHHLVTLEKWMDTRAGYSYFDIGKIDNKYG